jgi:hypothetical protein
MYWTPELIGVADCLSDTQFVNGSFSLKYNDVSESRSHQSGRVLIWYLVREGIIQPEIQSCIWILKESEWPIAHLILSPWVDQSGWNTITYSNPKVIRVADCLSDTRSVKGSFRLKYNYVLESQSNWSGQLLIWYWVRERIIQAESPSCTQITE